MGEWVNGLHRIARRSVGAVAVVAVLSLVMTGCTAPQAESESDRQAAAFPEVYGKTIEWDDCSDEGFDPKFLGALGANGAPVDTFECARIDAPLDWNDPDNTETIRLAALRIPSTGAGEPLGTLFINPGGPGSSGVDEALEFSDSTVFRPILDNYDFVGFDPRGIARSSGLSCEAQSSIKELNIARCVEAEPLAASMGTSQVARDLDLLRSLMGDEKLNYLGYSWGTVLGATFSTLFPERVGRMVLDSAVAADWSSPIGTFDQRWAIDRELRQMIDGCGTLYAVDVCPVANADALQDAFAALNTEPLTASDGSTIDGERMFIYLLTSLYKSDDRRALALEAAGGALKGDQEKIDAIALALAGGSAVVSLAGEIVKCHSFPADPRLVELVEHIEEKGLPVSMGGPEITDTSLRQWVDLACDALPNSGDDITDTFSGSPDAPILVIGVTRDHATPFEGAELLVEQLGNATLLTLDGTGHGASFLGRSTCVDDYATAYLLEGTMPTAGVVCTDD